MNKTTGKQGEDMATKYLAEKGYKILQRNYRCSYGEIDIICSQGEQIIFVEVKTRKSTLYGAPEEAVTKNKIERIRKVALHYLNKAEYYPEIRFDVIAIIIDKEKVTIRHIIEAF